MKLWNDFSENHSDFSKNVVNFKPDTIEKLGIMNLSSYGNKSYASVVLSHSVVTFLGEGEDVDFCPCIYCVLFIPSVE